MDLDNNCLFCGIINKKLSSNIVYEDDKVIGFEDINPQAPIHILVVPKKHIATLNHCDPEDKELIGHVIYIASTLAQKYDIVVPGYRVVCNVNAGAGQSVFHIHFHLLGGRYFNWPPG